MRVNNFFPPRHSSVLNTSALASHGIKAPTNGAQATAQFQ